MTTWDTIYSRLSVFLDDELNTEYGLQQRVDGWNSAQRMLAVQHTPRERVTSLVLESDGRSASLPTDFLAIKAVYDADESRWWQSLRLPLEGGYRAVDEQSRVFWVHGNVLYLERDVDENDDIDLLYYAYWPDVETETLNGTLSVVNSTDVMIPLWAELPCLHLTAAFCLQPGAIQAADIRQWNISVDSGNPLHNVRAQQAREHVWWWDACLGRVPPVDYHHGH